MLCTFVVINNTSYLAMCTICKSTRKSHAGGKTKEKNTEHSQTNTDEFNCPHTTNHTNNITVITFIFIIITLYIIKAITYTIFTIYIKITL